MAGLSRLVLDFLDHRDVYFDSVNPVPGMPGMRVRKEVNVETITLAADRDAARDHDRRHGCAAARSCNSPSDDGRRQE
jgi:hypothetical protein